jgi:hypothetical protein
VVEATWKVSSGRAATQRSLAGQATSSADLSLDCRRTRRSLRHVINGPNVAVDPHAAEQLLPLVYEVLRKLAAAKLAQAKPGHLICLPLSI